MNQKGMELPVNMIIIIAIAVLVLVVIAAFFANQTGTGFNSIQVENAFSSACGQLRSVYSCTQAGMAEVQIKARLKSTDTETSTYNVNELCALKNLPTTTVNGVNACLRACGCTS
jgi:hypothetical protein